MKKVYVDYVTNDELGKENWIDVKIEILYDMAILRRKKCGNDVREDEVREMLSKCNSKHQMDILLHDVIRGSMSLNDLLDKEPVFLKGVS